MRRTDYPGEIITGFEASHDTGRQAGARDPAMAQRAHGGMLTAE